MTDNKKEIAKLTRKLKQIEKEQDKLGISGYDYAREERVYGNDWKRISQEIKRLKEKP